MADTLTTTTTVSTIPSGSIIATDDAGAAGHVQVVKLALSADGSATAITADANGLEVQGAGVAGTPAGGVVTVQGVASGTVLPVGDGAGTLTVDAPVGTPVFVRLSDGSAAITTLPVSAASLPLPSGAASETTLSALNTKVVTAKTADYDTGVGTDTVQMVGVALPASGGAVAGGTSTNPLRTDPTGTTTQPVSAASLPLPSGAATLTEQQTQTTALQLIDDAVYTDGVGTPSKALGIAGTDGTNPQIVKTDAAGELQVDVLTLPAVTNAGTFAVQESGAALTALQLIDNIVKTEDAAHVDGDAGVMSLAVRRDANTSLVGLDGDYAPLQVNADGSLKVAITAGAGSGGTALADKAAFTEGSTSHTPIGGVFNETITADPTEDQAAAVRITAKRAIHANLRNVAGTEVGTAAAPVRVDPTGTTTQPVSAASLPLPTGAATLAEQQTQTTALQLLDDTVATDGAAAPTKGLMLAGTDGTNAQTVKVDTAGELQVDVLTLPALVAGTANIGDVDVLTVPAPLSTAGGGTEATALRVTLASDSTGLVSVDDNGGSLTVDGTVTASNTAGDIASDAVDSGNPVKVGAIAKSADITAVADADRVNLVASLLGKLLTLPYATPAKTWSYAAAAGGLVTTTGVTAKAAGAAGVRNYITRVQAINSHQTTGTEVVIRDGAAGAVLWRGWAQAAGGGCAAVFDPPLRGTAATLVEIAEITATATAGVLMSLQGYEASE